MGRLIISIATIWFSLVPVAVMADSGHPGAKTGEHHRTVTGEKSGLLTVKTADGTTMSVTPKEEARHGHDVPKVGEEVTIILNENNNIIDVHHKGKEGAHSFVTGKLVYVGKMKPESSCRRPRVTRPFRWCVKTLRQEALRKAQWSQQS